MADEYHNLLVELTCGDDARAEPAVAKLAELGVEILPSLKALLDSTEMDSRWWAIRTLAQMEKPPSAWLIVALSDPAAEVRQCAALAIYHHSSADAIPALIRMLAEPDPISTELAADALSALGSEAVPALLAALEGGSHKTRLEVVRSLANIGDERAIPALMDAYEEDSLSMQYWAEKGFERLGLDTIYISP